MTRIKFYSDTAWVNFVARVERLPSAEMKHDPVQLIAQTSDPDVIELALEEGGVLLPH